MILDFAGVGFKGGVVWALELNLACDILDGPGFMVCPEGHFTNWFLLL